MKLKGIRVNLFFPPTLFSPGGFLIDELINPTIQMDEVWFYRGLTIAIMPKFVW